MKIWYTRKAVHGEAGDRERYKRAKKRRKGQQWSLRTEQRKKRETTRQEPEGKLRERVKPNGNKPQTVERVQLKQKKTVKKCYSEVT